MTRVYSVCAALALAGAASAQITFSVPGTSCPWLSGSPNGTTAGGGGDVAPAQSPVLVSFAVTPGQVLQFINVTGQASNDPLATLSGADGDQFFLTKFAPENGIGSTRAPRAALMGTFVGAGVPVSGPNPGDLGNMFMDYQYGAAVADLTAASISAPLQAAFFIGDGLTGTGSGSVQSFVVPAGATRLFLGVMDSFQWANNVGGYQVTVIPAPATVALLGLGGLAMARRRR
jgi:hypothetical protein